jgi:RNA polymerase sigma factor (sigma-70 family)
MKPNSNPFRIDKKQTDGIWTMDEIILMRKLKRKDEWALGKIIDLYSSYITCIVWELLHKKGTKEDIEEVVADTFISLWLTAERINYKKYSSVKSYLGMIARNKAKDWLRAYRGEILELNDDILLIDGNVEHLILQKEQQLIIGRTLEKLRETDRKIFIMYYYRYKKIEEIAETLKMNPQTVKTRLRRGRETLKRILLEEGYDASEV